LPASPASLADVTLGLAISTRTIDVVVRSAVAAPLEGAEVILLTGRQNITSMDDFARLHITGIQARFARPVVGEQAPRPALRELRSGDLVAHIEHAGLGELTACAVNFGGDLQDPSFVQRMQAHASQLAIKCEPIGWNAAVVVLYVPPQQRF
jgi:hypothetical protein